MRSVNKVTLLGNLGKDAEGTYTPSGVSKVQFSLATARRWKDQHSGEWKEETDWHRIVLWRRENLVQFLTKGTRVYVEGRLQTRSWDDQNGKKQYMTEVIGEEVILLNSSGNGERSSGEYHRPPSQNNDYDQSGPPVDHDVPF